LLRRLAPLTFLIRVHAFRDPLRGELRHVHIFVNDVQVSDIFELTDSFTHSPISHAKHRWLGFRFRL
jgi:hypothetical protein